MMIPSIRMNDRKRHALWHWHSSWMSPGSAVELSRRRKVATQVSPTSRRPRRRTMCVRSRRYQKNTRKAFQSIALSRRVRVGSFQQPSPCHTARLPSEMSTGYVDLVGPHKSRTTSNWKVWNETKRINSKCLMKERIWKILRVAK
jgi:hypothetical protein